MTKVVLSAALAVLYLGAQLAIALSPLEDLAWLTGIFTRGAIAVLCYPVVWTLCFAAFESFRPPPIPAELSSVLVGLPDR